MRSNIWRTKRISKLCREIVNCHVIPSTYYGSRDYDSCSSRASIWPTFWPFTLVICISISIHARDSNLTFGFNAKHFRFRNIVTAACCSVLAAAAAWNLFSSFRLEKGLVQFIRIHVCHQISFRIVEGIESYGGTYLVEILAQNYT